MTAYTIGTLARAAGVNLETIRYYQRRGLIATPRKPPGSVRRYPPETLARLRFIKRAQQLGFTLRDIRELLTLGEEDCRATRARAEAHLAILEDRLRDLTRMRKTLRALITACRDGQDTHCPIVETLAQDAPLSAPRVPAKVRRSS